MDALKIRHAAELTVGEELVHSHHGLVKFTDSCAQLQKTNPDPSSVFVELDGEILEVTLGCVRRARLGKRS